MKALLAVLAIGLIAATSFAEDMAMNNFKKAMTIRVGDLSKSQELKLRTFQVSEGLCGSEGPSLVAVLSVSKPEKVLNNVDGKLMIVEKFEDIKTYGVEKSSAVNITPEKLAPLVMDSETCLE